MTQMTAQVFFVASSAKDAVLVPLTALRPVAAEGRPRGPRASGTDPRNQFAKGRALVSVVDAMAKSPTGKSKSA